MKYYLFLLMAGIFFSCSSDSKNQDDQSMNEAPEEKFRLVEDQAEEKVNVLIDGELFTAYIYPDDIKKPTLWPIKTESGKILTRRFPMDTIAGEQVDHPHHVGLWLNYGDVNGLDFWNNSEAIPPEKRENYGTIRHQEVVNVESGNDQGVLQVEADWVAPDGEVLLKEETKFVFHEIDGIRVIDRYSELTAQDTKVDFTDNKEGMIAVRVTRALEIPSDKASKLTDAHGNVTIVEPSDDTTAKGNYISSEGVEGNDVWGTRAKWVKLYSEMEGEPVSISILDHPSNVGYPTYWHARGYGLFSANPLGQKIFSEGEEELNFSLEPGESTKFNYRVLVNSGNVLETQKIEEIYQDWASSSPL